MLTSSVVERSSPHSGIYALLLRKHISMLDSVETEMGVLWTGDSISSCCPLVTVLIDICLPVHFVPALVERNSFDTNMPGHPGVEEGDIVS